MFDSPMVNLYTRDIDAALAFYRDLCGFTETFRTPREGTPAHVEMRLDGFTLGLGTVEAAKVVHGVDAEPGTPAMVIVLWTDDLEGEYARLVEAGVHLEKQPHDAGNGNRSALLRDPDGNLVELVTKHE